MQVGPWWVDGFSLRVAVAGAIAVAYAVWTTRRWHGPKPAVLGWCCLGLLVVALALGRLGYVVENLDYFLQNPHDVLSVRVAAGIHGSMALLGVCLSVILWSRFSGHGAWTSLSWLSPSLLLIAAGGWWACHSVGCAWGRAPEQVHATVDWLLVELPDLYHVHAPRYPVQLMGLIWSVCCALAAHTLQRDGSAALGVYLAGASLLTTLRGDVVPTIGTLRMDSVVQLTLCAALGVWSVFHVRVRRITTRTA
jgi:prolipoprotein diacylglyceryltransferase